MTPDQLKRIATEMRRHHEEIQKLRMEIWPTHMDSAPGPRWEAELWECILDAEYYSCEAAASTEEQLEGIGEEAIS